MCKFNWHEYFCKSLHYKRTNYCTRPFYGLNFISCWLAWCIWLQLKVLQLDTDNLQINISMYEGRWLNKYLMWTRTSVGETKHVVIAENAIYAVNRTTAIKKCKQTVKVKYTFFCSGITWYLHSYYWTFKPAYKFCFLTSKLSWYCMHICKCLFSHVQTNKMNRSVSLCKYE